MDGTELLRQGEEAQAGPRRTRLRDGSGRRRRDAPKPRYPAELPIVGRRDEIVSAIRQNQVLILSGETGSGKTTQLPKMCIEAGRGIDGLIGCTQPRRIAALTVSARIAEELGDEDLVGCRIRFHDSSKPGNFIRVMTDGILLAEARTRPSLKAYDTIIIDEAHERSLNIDVLLGLARRLIDRRKDLKVIITSATLDTEKFSRHFRDAPIIEVSGRTYPVEIRYRPSGDDEGASIPERTVAALREIAAESRRGDILAFLPTELDIRDSLELVRRDFGERFIALPLFARLPASEQRRVFQPGGGRKFIAATNVAETSLTIPGIRYVVDIGLARISRYSPGTGTHGLPIEPISRASADQRSGRCGRVEDGVCLRLYTEEDYRSRPEYTAPEIRRTNLADAALRLIDAGITDIESFPFVDPPAPAGIRDALRTLREIGAIEQGKTRLLTADGRLMARLPLDPRLARMLIQAEREGVLGDLLPIAAALSIQDPREKPPEKAAAAEAAHGKFHSEHSDFLRWLNIWDGFRNSGKKGSYSGKLKRYCRENFLSFRRMREWMDVHRQLALAVEESGYRIHRSPPGPWVDRRGEYTARYRKLHRSVLSGFLSHIARRVQSGSYEATRNRSASIHPGSGLKKSSPEWIVAAELVRTSRLFARSAAAIEPEWLLDLGAHLLRRNCVGPHWSRKAGAVMAEEQIRLFGFLISDSTMVPYGDSNPSEAREIFIRHALAGEDLADPGKYPFIEANAALRRRLRDMEAKLRRKDLTAGDDAVEAFYSRQLPPWVLDIETLNRHLRETRDSPANRLIMEEADLLTGAAGDSALSLYPDAAAVAGESWTLSYVFDTESPTDGVTLNIPPGRLSELQKGGADWAVPGLLEEKAEALMRALPKKHRRQLIPIPQSAAEAVQNMSREGDFVHALSSWLYRERRIDIPPGEWNAKDIPEHLKIRFGLLDERGREIAASRDPLELRNLAASSGESTGGSRAKRYREKHEQTGLTQWPGDIPESVAIDGGAMLWPALADEGASVSLRYLDDGNAAAAAHPRGQCRLASIYWARSLKDFRKSMPLTGQARVSAICLGGPSAVEDALWEQVLRDLFGTRLVRSREDWESLLADGGSKIHGRAQDYFAAVSGALTSYGTVRRALLDLGEGSHRRKFVLDCLASADAIAKNMFLYRPGPPAWKAMPRWLQASVSRARRGAADPARERRFTESWNPLCTRLANMRSTLSPMATDEKRRALDEASVMMEELRVTLCAAGEVRPGMKISESRMVDFLNQVDRMI